MDRDSNKTRVLEFLFDSKGQHISGEFIAKSLNISRQRVSSIVKQLKNDGYPILSKTKTGYYFNQPCDILTKHSLLKCLPSTTKLYFLETIDSTNTYAKNFIVSKEWTSPTLVVAREQTNGRGRFGKQFFSPKDTGTYFSIIIKPSFDISNASLLTITVAVAVAKVLESFGLDNVGIKWVNDIFINNRKAAGILTEASFDLESGHINHIIIGIGINVTTDCFPSEIQNIAGSLNINIPKAKLIANICDEINSCIKLSPEKIVQLYKEKSILNGKDITYTQDGTLHLAKVININEQGKLMIIDSNGNIRTLDSGEVTLLTYERTE